MLGEELAKFIKPDDNLLVVGVGRGVRAMAMCISWKLGIEWESRERRDAAGKLNKQRNLVVFPHGNIFISKDECKEVFYILGLKLKIE